MDRASGRSGGVSQLIFCRAAAEAGCVHLLQFGRLRGQATRICQGALAQSDRIAAPSLASDTAAFLRRGTYVLGPELAQLETLRPPSDQAGTYSAALAAASRQVTILDDTVRQLDRGADPMSLIKTLQRRLRSARPAGTGAQAARDSKRPTVQATGEASTSEHPR